MKSNRVVLMGLVMSSAVAWGQIPWPAVQAGQYPLVSGLELIRHEQSVLLGEGSEQTGLFFARLPKAYTQEVQIKMVADAASKGWTLKTAMRQGTAYTLTFSKKQRLLDIRLSTVADGVDVVYSVALSQQPVVEPWLQMPPVVNEARPF